MQTIVINIPQILLIIFTYYIFWLICHFILDKIDNRKTKHLDLFKPFRLKLDIPAYMFFGFVVTFVYMCLYTLFSYLLTFNYVLTF